MDDRQEQGIDNTGIALLVLPVLTLVLFVADFFTDAPLSDVLPSYLEATIALVLCSILLFAIWSCTKHILLSSFSRPTKILIFCLVFATHYIGCMVYYVTFMRGASSKTE